MPEIEIKKDSPWGAFKRWMLASAGVGCVGLAYVGAIVPGMPTTIFLIMACYLFTRSCPYLEERLVRNRYFARFLVYLDKPTQMPMRARVIALTAMWISASVSAAILGFGPESTRWISPLVIALAAVGTLVILAMGRWTWRPGNGADRAATSDGRALDQET